MRPKTKIIQQLVEGPKIHSITFTTGDGTFELLREYGSQIVIRKGEAIEIEVSRLGPDRHECAPPSGSYHDGSFEPGTQWRCRECETRWRLETNGHTWVHS